MAGDWQLIFKYYPHKNGGSKPPPYVRFKCYDIVRPHLTSAFVSTRYFAYAQYDKAIHAYNP